jgi:hypothetical protein
VSEESRRDRRRRLALLGGAHTLGEAVEDAALEIYE